MKKYLLPGLCLLALLLSLTACGGGHAHIAVPTAGREPTCTESGAAAGTKCLTCGEPLSGGEMLPALGHDEEPHEGKAAACLAAGYAPYVTCRRCAFTTYTEIPQTGHDFTAGDSCTVCGAAWAEHIHQPIIEAGVAATCTEAGLTGGTYCGFCGEVLTPRIPTPATGHTPIIDMGVPPTFTEAGLTEGSHCGTCGLVLIPREELPVLEAGTVPPLTPYPGGGIYGYLDFTDHEKGGALQILYCRMDAACRAFLCSTADVAPEQDIYSIAALSYSDLGLTREEAIAVYRVFCYENPRYYWLSRSVNTTDLALLLSIDAVYADAGTRATVDGAIAAAVAECQMQLSDDLSELERALAIHDYVLGRMVYAYQADGVTPSDEVWAHNMEGFVRYGRGVCEAYAKTYLYLCRLNGLDCLFVSGDADGAHAWNLVKIDGLWYGVDGTWDDVGDAAILYTCFGLSGEKLALTHTPDRNDAYGLSYLYELPRLSGRDITLAYLYREGVYAGVYVNADAALAAMTDQAAHYELKLFHYGAQPFRLEEVAHPVQELRTAATPAVAGLVIDGYNTAVAGDDRLPVELYIDGLLTLQSDVTFVSVGINHTAASEGAILDIGGFTCRFALRGYRFTLRVARITGNADGLLITDRGGNITVVGTVGVTHRKE